MWARKEEEIKNRVMEALKAQVPSGVSSHRVDEVIIFHQLGREHIKRIVDLQFDLLKKRLADRHIEIKLTEKAKNYCERRL